MTTAFDSTAFRRTLGRFATGVTIITVRAEDGTPMGLTANSFTSVSLDPPLVLVCISKSIASYKAFRVDGTYAVHILAEDQQELSTLFATRGADRFGHLQWREGLGGAPVLPDYLALLECRIVQSYDGGDHTIFMAQVERVDVPDGERRALGFFQGKYVTI